MLCTFNKAWTWNESGELRRYKGGMEYDVSTACGQFAEREGLLLEGKMIDGAPDNKMMDAPANKARKRPTRKRKT